MPVTRMRMRPWLEKKIESNSVPGLSWVDKEKTMFSIPWKHAARHGWELDKDASLFKLWAIHTGKYVEGQTCDPKTWKANFRCTMNSLPDVEEVKDKSINKGHQAMSVYRLLPSTPKSRDKRSKAKQTKTMKKGSNVKTEEEDSEEDTSSAQENTVDSTVNTKEKDFSFVAPSEVPRFEVSPEHSPDFDETDQIIQICQQLEKDSHWMPTCSLDGTGFLSNEACTSPGSQWSDSSTDFSFVAPSEVPRFEVSPEHSPDFDETDQIIQICQQLEKDLHLMPTCSLDGTGFLSNEACTSPGSQWSDSSTVDELDEIPQYITLGSDPPRDEFWENFCQQFPPFH